MCVCACVRLMRSISRVFQAPSYDLLGADALIGPTLCIVSGELLGKRVRKRQPTYARFADKQVIAGRNQPERQLTIIATRRYTWTGFGYGTNNTCAADTPGNGRTIFVIKNKCSTLMSKSYMYLYISCVFMSMCLKFLNNRTPYVLVKTEN